MQGIKGPYVNRNKNEASKSDFTFRYNLNDCFMPENMMVEPL